MVIVIGIQKFLIVQFVTLALLHEECFGLYRLEVDCIHQSLGENHYYCKIMTMYQRINRKGIHSLRTRNKSIKNTHASTEESAQLIDRKNAARTSR